MNDVITILVIAIGSIFALLAAVGIVRMPDLYMRIQAATKASTFGVSFIVLAAVLQFDDLGAKTRALLIIAFIVLTAPVAAHMIGRAAYSAGVPLWKQTMVDELRTAEPPAEDE